MVKEQVLEISRKPCKIYADDAPEYVIIQPTGTHENEQLDEEIVLIRQNTDKKFCFVSYPIEDWDRELSPWKAPQAFSDSHFGDGAEDTLYTITKRLIPELQRQINPAPNAKYILGGYSLAGLFSLWTAYQTDLFDTAAACSPSVWIEGWQEYVEHRTLLTRHIYLSLGTKEHKTRNPILQTVKQAAMHQHELLQKSGIHTTLEWNPGNHFQGYTERMSKAFLWAINQQEI